MRHNNPHLEWRPLGDVRQAATQLWPAYRRERWRWWHKTQPGGVVPSVNRIAQGIVDLEQRLPASRWGRIRSGGIMLERRGGRTIIYVDAALLRWLENRPMSVWGMNPPETQ